MSTQSMQEAQRILVIEDHVESADLLKWLLEGEQCVVKCIENGQDALDVLQLAPESPGNFQPDVILLDLRLPDMSGVEFVQTLRRLVVKTPAIILLSADPPSSLRDAAQSIGVKALRKPFEFDELYAAICNSAHRSARS